MSNFKIMHSNKKKDCGMTLSELTISFMVLVVFLSTFAVSTKYFQSAMKADDEGNSWLSNENKILQAMDNWSQIISQPSYKKEFVESLGCSYKPNSEKSMWGLPGVSNNDLPLNYKFCVVPTSLVESDLSELINNEKNAKPGIYIIKAIPDKITSTSQPLRRLICRPITYC